MPAKRSTYVRPRTLKTDLAALRRDGFFGDLLTLVGFGGTVALSVAGSLGAAVGVVVLFDAIH